MLGYLLAFGALTALMRRMQDGGSWHAEISLVPTGRWIRDLSRVENRLAATAPTNQGVAGIVETSESGWGRLHSVRHSAVLSETPAWWERPFVPVETHPPYGDDERWFFIAATATVVIPL